MPQLTERASCRRVAVSMPFERSDQTDNGSAQPETVATLLLQWACATLQAFKRQMLCGPGSVTTFQIGHFGSAFGETAA